MKKLLIILYMFVAFMATYALYADTSGGPSKENPLLSVDYLPDSIKSTLDDKSFIVKIAGHHGAIWTLIYQDGDMYHIRVGSTRARQPDKDAVIDTVAFVKANRKLFDWGIDSMPVIGKKMAPQYREQYVSFYDSWYVFNSVTGESFRSDNAIGFSGPGSVDFNKKFHRLDLLILWLSCPEFREYVPHNDIYGSDH